MIRSSPSRRKRLYLCYAYTALAQVYGEPVSVRRLSWLIGPPRHLFVKELEEAIARGEYTLLPGGTRGRVLRRIVAECQYRKMLLTETNKRIFYSRMYCPSAWTAAQVYTGDQVYTGGRGVTWTVGQGC